MSAVTDRTDGSGLIAGVHWTVLRLSVSHYVTH
jgi:hypothetical protein